MKKRLLAAILATTMVLSMVACGGNEAEDTNKTTGNESNSFSRLSFVLYYLYFEPFFYCFGVDFPCHILFIFSRVAKYVAIIAFE